MKKALIYCSLLALVIICAGCGTLIKDIINYRPPSPPEQPEPPVPPPPPPPVMPPVTPPTPPADPNDALGPERGETEVQARERMIRWYPALRRGGKTEREQQGFQGTPNNSIRIKPESENDKKLVILTPSRVRVTEVTVPGGETRRATTGDGVSISNGHRLTFRFSKPGGAYPAGQMTAKMSDGRRMVADYVPGRNVASTPWRIE